MKTRIVFACPCGRIDADCAAHGDDLRWVNKLGENNKELTRIVGEVKWFDPVKGFGFVVSEDGGPDVLLHANVLRNFGQSTVADAARIEIDVQQPGEALGLRAVEGKRGRMAIEVSAWENALDKGAS